MVQLHGENIVQLHGENEAGLYLTAPVIKRMRPGGTPAPRESLTVR
jgi:hypothetical protein